MVAGELEWDLGGSHRRRRSIALGGTLRADADAQVERLITASVQTAEHATERAPSEVACTIAFRRVEGVRLISSNAR